MQMSFREKSAWVSLILILLVFGPYFWLVGRSFAGIGHVHAGTQFALITLFVVLEIVVHIAIAIQSPRDARAPKDEREILRIGLQQTQARHGTVDANPGPRRVVVHRQLRERR